MNRISSSLQRLAGLAILGQEGGRERESYDEQAAMSHSKYIYITLVALIRY